MPPLRRLALVALVVPLCLSGCAEDEPEPIFQSDSPAPEASAATSEDTSPTEPSSNTAEGESEAAALAFAARWVDLFNNARLSFHTEELAAASTPNCATCSNFVQTVDAWRENGTTYESRAWSILDASVHELGPGTASLVLQIRRPAEEITHPGGRRERNGASTADYHATLKRSGDSWKMHELVIPG